MVEVFDADEGLGVGCVKPASRSLSPRSGFGVRGVGSRVGGVGCEFGTGGWGGGWSCPREVRCQGTRPIPCLM